MNIFDQYLDKIKKILLDLSENGELILPDKLDGITTLLPQGLSNRVFSLGRRAFIARFVIPVQHPNISKCMITAITQSFFKSGAQIFAS